MQYQQTSMFDPPALPKSPAPPKPKPRPLALNAAAADGPERYFVYKFVRDSVGAIYYELVYKEGFDGIAQAKEYAEEHDPGNRFIVFKQKTPPPSGLKILK